MLKKSFMFCQQEVNFYFGTVVCVAKIFLQKHQWIFNKKKLLECKLTLETCFKISNQ